MQPRSGWTVKWPAAVSPSRSAKTAPESGFGWHSQVTRAAGGRISRQHALHYAMGLGHEEWATDGVVTRQIDAINDESNQRAYYGGWADFMSGADWDELRRRRADWEGVPAPQPGGAGG